MNCATQIVAQYTAPLSSSGVLGTWLRERLHSPGRELGYVLHGDPAGGCAITDSHVVGGTPRIFLWAGLGDVITITLPCDASKINPFLAETLSYT